ncbi:deaminase [Actinokineospora sp. NBRC 105648]|uniref:deoxycytidylate deaminase n=1 Tax=Actinokineospora sp. NBRC 105648 TaxID=3032206 RepID=UPI0024A48A30|nr:deaminase [Actinokineospora sp. NBRC 105648]GLZ37517.1 hypothetical protein Acsp05_11420 [Actinokineospora sp. NBRC 105648]
MPAQLMLYLPVLHAGYERLVEKHSALGAEVLLLGRGFGERYPVVRKGIRALDPKRVVEYLCAVDGSLRVSVVEPEDLPARVSGPTLFLPDETLMRDIVRDFRLRERAEVSFDASVLLRWDRKQSKTATVPQVAGVVSTDKLAQRYSALAKELGGFSPDWWRQVGAVAVRDEVVLATAYNTHLPSEYELYAHGDPRDAYRKKQRLDLTTALHAEATVIGHAARDGVSLRGADMYASTFPCPSCARLIVAAGFARCFFAEGYSMLAGDQLMREAGIEVFSVDLGEHVERQLSLDDLSGDLATDPAGN